MLFNMGAINLGYSEETLHSWEVALIHSKLSAEGIPLKVIDIKSPSDLKKLKPLKYNSIFEPKMFLQLNIAWTKIDTNLINAIKEIDLSKRIMYLNVRSEYGYKYLNKVLSSMFSKTKNKFYALPLSDSWSDKAELLESYLKDMGLRVENYKTKKELVRLMMIHQNLWESLKIQLEQYVRDDTTLKMNDIKNIFADVDYYNLFDFYIAILRGTGKRKRYVQLRYFLSDKEFPPAWLLSYFREMTLQVSRMYNAYMRGVISHNLDDADFSKRLEYSEYKEGLELLELSPKQRRELLSVVKEVPYNYFVDFSKVLNDVKYLNPTEVDIYRLFVELNKILARYDVPKGFAPKRW